MFENFGTLIIGLSGNIAVLIVLAYFINRSSIMNDWAATGKQLKYILLIGTVGGIFGIYGTLASINVQGAMISVRDVGPMMAGAFGGPFAGLIAGLIAGVHRFAMGGITQVACSIATVTIGLFSGLLAIRLKKRLQKPVNGIILAIVMEMWHIGLVLLITKPFETALLIVKAILIPFVAMNAAGFGLMLYVMKIIKDRRESDMEKHRLGAELDVARNIQASMLPCIFPAFPERKEFDIYATMTPAKEVGGDFYDFFLVDDDHLAMVMADVSGKGVPAALFMVVAKTLIKDCAQTGSSPKEILEKVNDQLCQNNDAEMFVTVWIGIMEISSGKIVCANAGHEYPTIMRKDGEYELIRDKHGFVVAGMPGMKYKEYEIKLEPGERLFLYTDGVPEATSGDNELYGTDRMLKALNSNKEQPSERLLNLVKSDIDVFVGDAPQFDDITMMVLENNA